MSIIKNIHNYPETFNIQCTQCDSRNTELRSEHDESDKVTIVILHCNNCGNRDEVY